jgi:FtsP/CotA-like multicopper oxidase with cupredoxin domain
MRSFTITALLCALSVAPSAAQNLQQSGWDDQLKLREAIDGNPNPRIFETTIEARVAPIELSPGVKVNAWTYDGGVPGPLIRARVGDRLIVHFSNKLPQSTTIHWHGVQVPIQMDGVPGVSQPPVEPNGSFTYDFVVPDAGLFWYHPHVLSAAQVGFGLYGALLVDEPVAGIGSHDQLVLVLSDMALNERTGELDSPDSGGNAGALFGREGNHVLVNGRERATLKFREGALQRWRIVNSSKSRYFNLVLGRSQPMMLIGVDGGLLEDSIATDQVVIAPGERADVLVAPRSENGLPPMLSSFPFNRGYGSIEYRSVEDLVQFEPVDLPPVAATPLPRLHRSIAPISSAGANPIELKLIMTDTDGIAGFGIAGGPFWRGTSVRAKLGETQIWTITNHAVWAHPIHLHGFFFQPVDEKGEPLRPLQWKDTISVPANSARRFLVRLDRPGSWMYHCHILDHAEAGLMSAVDVGVDMPATHEHTHP